MEVSNHHHNRHDIEKILMPYPHQTTEEELEELCQLEDDFLMDDDWATFRPVDDTTIDDHQDDFSYCSMSETMSLSSYIELNEYYGNGIDDEFNDDCNEYDNYDIYENNNIDIVENVGLLLEQQQPQQQLQSQELDSQIGIASPTCIVDVQYFEQEESETISKLRNQLWKQSLKTSLFRPSPVIAVQ
jgi:Zn ribbon nucleic-acid-binding protein